MKKSKQPHKIALKRGDMVLVMRGKNGPHFDENGEKVYTKGRIMQILPKKNKALVEGVNMVKRHTKPNQTHQQGGIIEKEAPIDLSNVMIEDPQTKKPTRIGHKFITDKKGETTKVRYAKSSGEILTD